MNYNIYEPVCPKTTLTLHRDAGRAAPARLRHVGSSGWTTLAVLTAAATLLLTCLRCLRTYLGMHMQTQVKECMQQQ